MAEIVEVIESYYGEGAVRRGKTYLLCHLEPSRISRPPRYWLVIEAVVPIAGPMVIETRRLTRLWKNGLWAQAGRPSRATKITYDSDPNPPGVWRAEMEGSWPVKLVRIRKRSRWERLRRA